jgi:hypothetical protein
MRHTSKRPTSNCWQVDGERLALIGASWGEVAALVDICSKLGTVESNVRVPDLGLLPCLSPSEHLEQMLAKPLTLVALLKIHLAHEA